MESHQLSIGETKRRFLTSPGPRSFSEPEVAVNTLTPLSSPHAEPVLSPLESAQPILSWLSRPQWAVG